MAGIEIPVESPHQAYLRGLEDAAKLADSHTELHLAERQADTVTGATIRKIRAEESSILSRRIRALAANK